MNATLGPAPGARVDVETGTLWGVGLGPGDPELMTVKAARVIARAPVVAYFAKRGRRGHARTIVEGLLAPGVEEIPLVYPMTTEIPFEDPRYGEALAAFYAEATERLALRLAAGRDVALLCEGDPFFYGSFMHLYERLKDRYPTRTIAAVTGMSGCWTAAGTPMTWGDDVLTVMPGTLGEDELVRRLEACDAAVVMKLGQNFDKVRRAVARAGLESRAIYVERGTMAEEKILPLAACEGIASTYFAIVLVPGRGRRP